MLKVGSKIWGCMCLAISGCAINENGLTRIRYFENASSYLLTQDSWGGLISTRQADGGLTLGHAERLFIYPKPGKKPQLSLEEILQLSSRSEFEREIEAQNVDLTDVRPYAWMEQNQGIMLHANPLKTGISAGLELRSVIRLPADFDGVFMVRYLEDGRIESVIYEPRK